MPYLKFSALSIYLHIDGKLIPSKCCSIEFFIVCDIWSAFQMDDEKFRRTYGISKLTLKSKQIVLHCLKGKRAFDAADKLALLGYDDIFVYKVH